MQTRKVLLVPLMMLAATGLGFAKNKKPDVPAVFGNATYAYVEAVNGDEFKPGVYPDDRQAIYAVQESLKDWNRYTLTMHRNEADLVFVIRKGRVAGVQPHVGISSGPLGSSGQASTQYPNSGTGQAGQQRGTSVGTEAEVGPSDDLLRVYTLTQDGKLVGPIWTREMDGGLDAPNVELVRQLRIAVDRAYPQPPPKKP